MEKFRRLFHSRRRRQRQFREKKQPLDRRRLVQEGCGRELQRRKEIFVLRPFRNIR